MREFLATISFMTVLVMMLAPWIVMSLGFTGLQLTTDHVWIGATGLVLFFVLPALGAYGSHDN